MNIFKKVFSKFLLLVVIILSCKKDPGTDPKSEENPITGIPTLSSVPGSSVSFEAATSTYTVTVPAGTNIKTLRLNIPLIEGATISPDPATARDYTNPVKYTIAHNGKTQQVTVKVEVSDSAKSSAKLITGFRFAALNTDAEIDQNTRKISVKVSDKQDITKLIPTITLSEKATVSPASGVVQNFTNSVNYTVTAENGSKQVYEVKVEKETIGGGKACLLTRSERTYITNGNQVTYITEYGYDDKGRIVSMKIYKSGNIENSNIIKISYNGNGDIAETQVIDSGVTYRSLRFTYQNNKIAKMEVENFYQGNSIWVDYIASGVIKLNGDNELIEYNEFNYNELKFPRYILKYEYQSRNISKVEFYDDDDKTWDKVELSYDNKYSPLFASNPHPVFKAIFLYGLPQEWFGRNNVVSQRKDNDEILSVSYKYNDNNYPVEATTTDGELWKYHYSNCN